MCVLVSDLRPIIKDSGDFFIYSFILYALVFLLSCTMERRIEMFPGATCVLPESCLDPFLHCTPHSLYVRDIFWRLYSIWKFLQDRASIPSLIRCQPRYFWSLIVCWTCQFGDQSSLRKTGDTSFDRTIRIVVSMSGCVSYFIVLSSRIWRAIVRYWVSEEYLHCVT